MLLRRFSGHLQAAAVFFLLYDARTQDIRTSVYWDIGIQDTNPVKEEQAIQQFDALLTASIQKRLRSDVPVGASLSGRLNSSSIVAGILRQTRGGNGRGEGAMGGAGAGPADVRGGGAGGVPTFSAVFPGFAKDESSYIRLVADQFSLENHTTTPVAADGSGIWKNWSGIRKSLLSIPVSTRSSGSLNWRPAIR